MTDRKVPTIREVARLAEVSTATVSNVLGARKSVNPALAARVHAAVETLGYEPDRAASQLRSGRNRMIAVLVPSLENPFFTSIVAGLEQAVRPDGFDIVVASANDDPSMEGKRLAALLSWRPAGVVVIPTDDRFAARALLGDIGGRFVVVDRLPPGLAADTVAVDNEQAAVLAAGHLAALGHRDILVVASTLTIANVRSRLHAIRNSLAKAGLPRPEVLEAGLTLDLARTRLAAWFGTNHRPTGIVALTNFTTIGVMASLAQHGLRVPDDVSLVGFDDYMWMQAASPPITAIRQPVEQLGAEAWSCLRERIEQGRTASRAVRLASTLQVRGSTTRIDPPRAVSAGGKRRTRGAAAGGSIARGRDDR